MTAFRYRFASLLRYREHQRQMARQELGRLQAHADEIAATLTTIRQQKTAAQESFREQSRSGQLTAADWLDHTTFEAGLNARIAETIRQHEQAERIAETARERVREADREVKMLERLRDRDEAEWRLEAVRAEDREREENWRAARTGRRSTADHEPLAETDR